MPVKHVSIEAAQVDGFKIEVKARQHVAYVDQPPAGGGTDAGPTPLEYLFFSLSSCIVTIGHVVAKQQHLPVRKIEVTVEGDNVDRAINRLKRKMADEGVLKELKKRRFYEKPSVRKKRKQREAERRRRKEAKRRVKRP